MSTRLAGETVGDSFVYQAQAPVAGAGRSSGARRIVDERTIAWRQVDLFATNRVRFVALKNV
jgi:hypothetical protein